MMSFNNYDFLGNEQLGRLQVWPAKLSDETGGPKAKLQVLIGLISTVSFVCFQQHKKTQVVIVTISNFSRSYYLFKQTQ